MWLRLGWLSWSLQVSYWLLCFSRLFPYFLEMQEVNYSLKVLYEFEYRAMAAAYSKIQWLFICCMIFIFLIPRLLFCFVIIRLHYISLLERTKHIAWIVTLFMRKLKMVLFILFVCLLLINLISDIFTKKLSAHSAVSIFVIQTGCAWLGHSILRRGWWNSFLLLSQLRHSWSQRHLLQLSASIILLFFVAVYNAQ